MNPGGELDRGRLLGHVLFVAGALCWGIYSVIGKRAIARFGPVGATLWATTVGTALLLPFALAEQGWRELARADAAAWASIAYLAVFGTVLAFVFFYEGVRRIGSTRATAFALLVPIFGVVASVLILGEQLSPLTVVGGAVVVAGLRLVQHRGAEPAPELPPRAAADAR